MARRRESDEGFREGAREGEQRGYRRHPAPGRRRTELSPGRLRSAPGARWPGPSRPHGRWATAAGG